MSLLRSTAVVVHAPGGEVASFGRWHGPETPVVWGSVTKIFLAGAVAELVADGALAWSTPVSSLLAAVTPAGTKVPDIPVEQLVRHTSGLPRLVPEQMRMVKDPYGRFDDARFDTEVLDRLGDLRNPALADGEPLYSNLGYALLARAVTVSQGRPWIDVVRERVVAPAGVDPAEVFVATGQAPRPRTQARNVRGRPLSDWNPGSGPFSGASGLWASPSAMMTLLRSALTPGSPLDPGRTPSAWEGTAPVHTVDGAIMRSGGRVLVDTDTGTVALAHTVGGMAGRNAERAATVLDRALRSVAR